LERRHRDRTLTDRGQREQRRVALERAGSGSGARRDAGIQVGRRRVGVHPEPLDTGRELLAEVEADLTEGRVARLHESVFERAAAGGVGSNVGFEYIATTPPVFTSSTTTEPRRPASPAEAASWAWADIDSTTVPVWGWLENALESGLPRLRPASCDEYFASMPT